MKKIKKLMMVLVAFLCIGICAPTFSVNADDVITSLTVSPQHQRVMLVPGETYHGSIKVSSQARSTRETGYEVSVGPFSETKGEDSKDDYGNVNYIDKSTYNMIVDWITIDNPSGSVEPNGVVTVPFTINVPEDAPAGGQYASIIVTDATPPSYADDGVAVESVMQILSIIYAEVAGETRNEGVISSNVMPSFLLNGPLNAESMVRNNGNVHTQAEYTLQVWPLFSDEEICTNVEEPEKSLVMPETERYHAQSCDLPSVGIFKAKQTVKIFDQVSEVEKMVIICPLWLLFIILFVLIVLIIWIVMKVLGRKKKNTKKEPNE